VLPILAFFKTSKIYSQLVMKKPTQQLTPKTQSSNQFFNRLCSRMSPTSRKPLNNTLNAPIATSRHNRSRSIR
jgi:hypothetical protein